MNQLCPLEKASSLGLLLGCFVSPLMWSELLADDSGWADEFGLTLPPPPRKPASPAGKVIAP